MRLERLTWPQAEQYFNENDMVILAIGSIECHGTHMPLGTDTLIPNRILELIEEKSDVLIAPTIPYGATQYLSPFPGTINLGPDGLYTVVSKVVEGLWSHGARTGRKRRSRRDPQLVAHGLGSESCMEGRPWRRRRDRRCAGC